MLFIVNHILKKKLRSYYQDELVNNSVLSSLYSANKKSLSLAAVSASISKINVFYQSFYYTHVSESPQITPSTLLGTIGNFYTF